jgi:hypothetical protein
MGVFDTIDCAEDWVLCAGVSNTTILIRVEEGVFSYDGIASPLYDG